MKIYIFIKFRTTVKENQRKKKPLQQVKKQGIGDKNLKRIQKDTIKEVKEDKAFYGTYFSLIWSEMITHISSSQTRRLERP